MVAKVVELVDVQQLRGQEVLTRYHYFDADGVADPAVLVADYITDVVPKFAAFQIPAIVHTAIRYRTVYPAVGLQREVGISPAYVGQWPDTQPVPSFVSYSIKWQISDTVYFTASTKHINRGGKHLPGVPGAGIAVETDLVGGDIQALINTWFAEVKDPGTDPWQLIVAHAPATINKVPQVIQYYATVTGQSPASIGTQNTRKVIRGRTY